MSLTFNSLDAATQGLLSNNSFTTSIQGLLTFEEIQLVEEIITSTPKGSSYYDNYRKLTPEKKDKFITLTLKIKGETIIQKNQKQNYKVTAKDVNLVINTVLKENIQVNLKK